MRTEAKTTGPSSRRSCLVGSGLTAAVARSAEGASDRIRMGVIGTGTRGSYMATVLESREDCQVLAMADVFESNLGPAAAKLAFEPMNVSFRYVGGPSDSAHVRKFLDCVKSRQKPLTDVETGFYSTLPLLLGVLAVRYGEQCNWDGKSAVACG